jgi:AcrR family transcriptional regulator
MSRSSARKDAILEKLADFVLNEGLDAASLRPMAKAVGTSDRMLIYHFTDKNTLIAAILETIAARLVAQLSAQSAPHPVTPDQLRPHLLDMTLDDSIWPYLRLWLQIAARAAQGDLFFQAVGNQLGRSFIDWIAAQLASPHPQLDAAALLVTVEGLVLVKSLGLADLCRPALDA